MGVIQPLSGNGMDVTFAQDDVVRSPNLDLVSVLGIVENPIFELHGSHVGTNSNHGGPSQALADLGGCWDEDSSIGLSFAIRALDLHQDAVIEHLDGEFV